MKQSLGFAPLLEAQLPGRIKPASFCPLVLAAARRRSVVLRSVLPGVALWSVSCSAAPTAVARLVAKQLLVAGRPASPSG
jgi:hypothetical protein